MNKLYFTWDIEDFRNLTVSRAYKIRTSLGDTQVEITVPRGLSTDLSSVPRVFRGALPKINQYLAASVVHDFLYSFKLFPKANADTIFKSIMEDAGVNKRQVWILYTAVKLFGRSSWKKATRPKGYKEFRGFKDGVLEIGAYLPSPKRKKGK